jgi:K+-sensing histidine kinase KdpD
MLFCLGLGLSLFKAIVEAHQGRVKAMSKQGAGPEFRVFLAIRKSWTLNGRGLTSDWL